MKRAWLAALVLGLGCGALAAAAEPVGAKINLSASGVAPELLKEAAPTPRARPGAQLPRSSAGEVVADPWKRRLGGGPEQEDDSCILNFGIGGSLGKNGSVGSHFLGQNQVWSDQGAARSGK